MTAEPLRSSNGAVACENEIAAAAGIDILKQGGSAADAIITTQLCVGVIQSFMSGIGGGGFALVRTSEGEYDSLDFRVAAPLSVEASMYEGKDLTAVGGMAVGTPGELRGLEALHQAHGKLAWAELFQPAIKLARDGFACNEDLHWAIRRYTTPMETHHLPEDDRDTKLSWIHDHLQLAALFSRNGDVVPVGTTIKRPEYAHTLESIAHGGAAAFYEGQLAHSIVDAVHEAGGMLSLEDLRSFQCRRRKPLSVQFQGRKVVSTPAPSSGCVLLSALKTMSYVSDGSAEAGSASEAHLITESLKFAYANRTKLGDPAIVAGIDDLQQRLLLDETCQSYASRIDSAKTHDPSYYNEARLAVTPDHGTSHLTAADKDGLVVSMTTTIGLAWGSRVVAPTSGIVLNDTMVDFAVAGASNVFGYVPSEANYIVGGKRALSSTCPFMIEDKQGQFQYAAGAAGGSRILSSNAQHALNVLIHGMSPSEALRQPRLHNQLLPDETLLEDAHASEFESSFRNYGHKVRRIQRAETVACGVAFSKDKRCYDAGAEPRITNSAGYTT